MKKQPGTRLKDTAQYARLAHDPATCPRFFVDVYIAVFNNTRDYIVKYGCAHGGTHEMNEGNVLFRYNDADQVMIFPAPAMTWVTELWDGRLPTLSTWLVLTVPMGIRTRAHYFAWYAMQNSSRPPHQVGRDLLAVVGKARADVLSDSI